MPVNQTEQKNKLRIRTQFMSKLFWKLGSLVTDLSNFSSQASNVVQGQSI
jgi:hypothetical protein